MNQTKDICIHQCVFATEDTDQIRSDAEKLQSSLSAYRKQVIIDIQSQNLNIESMTVLLGLVQESQELLSDLRHTLRGKTKFELDMPL